MADTGLTKVGLFRAAYLCLLAVLLPEKLVRAQEADDGKRQQSPQIQAPTVHSAYLLHRAFWSSLILVLASGGLGYLLGLVIGVWLGIVSQGLIVILQVGGAMLILWATLFVRGWDIQTYGGATLTERVNRWLYRTMCCVGTVAIVCSLAL